MLLFRGDRTTQRKGEILSKWETSVYEFSLTKYKNPLIEMYVFGAEVLDYEMMKDGLRLAPFFGIGFGLMVLFVVITVNGTALLYGKFDFGKILVSFGATISSLMAVSTTYGLLSLIGFRLNSISLVLPFLVCGIGVDDAFLMIHSWQRLSSHRYSIQTRLGLVYEEVGPSITITSMTNVISFGIGTFLPTPEIGRFCMTTAMAILMDYIFELTLFGPMLVFATNFEKPTKDIDHKIFEKGWRKNLVTKADVLLRKYCKLISNRLFSILLLICTLIYWYFAISGILSIQTRLDSAKILPPDSPMQESNKIVNEYIWGEYHPVTIIVNNPLDITNPQKLQRFWDMVDEYESMERCKGNISTLLWLRDYETYFKKGDMVDALFDALGFSGNNETIISSLTGIDFSKLDAFLQSPFSQHWNAFLKVSNKGSQRYVTSFWFTVAYQNTSTWDARIELMKEWREIASRYSDMNVTVFEENAMFVDQILSIKNVAIITGLLTLACMAIVCAVFIPNICSVITATIAIASISMGVLGFYQWWNLDLDPVTMAAILMSIGLSVDFIVSFNFS
uniref:SSD domain-containing protein n=1 Tax=Panagrolaimus davidi TaxID=227884 RepID=A0A914Q133_9BILA